MAALAEMASCCGGDGGELGQSLVNLLLAHAAHACPRELPHARPHHPPCSKIESDPKNLINNSSVELGGGGAANKAANKAANRGR